MPRDPEAPIVEVNLVEWPLTHAEVVEAAVPSAEPEEGTIDPRAPEPEPAAEDLTNSRTAQETEPRMPGVTIAPSDGTPAE